MVFSCKADTSDAPLKFINANVRPYLNKIVFCTSSSQVKQFFLQGIRMLRQIELAAKIDPFEEVAQLKKAQKSCKLSPTISL